MPKSAKILLLAVSVVLVLSVLLTVSHVNAAEGAYRQINVYSEVLQHIQTEYVDVPNIQQVTDGALRGLLESLDADSSYLAPADYKLFKDERGGKAQVGLNVSKRYGYATVVATVPNSPADKAGLNDGDIIEAINDRDTRDISLTVIRLMLEGAPGSEVSVSVVRPRQSIPQKITMTRAAVTEPMVADTQYEGASILYLKPAILDHDHVQQIENKLKAMPKAGNKKLLLDLRDVAGGDMADATRLANMLLKSGTIATLEGQTVQKQVFTADPAKAINATAPVVVLVNRGTSGPAELVAASLQDNKRADLVGEKTFGEGSEQKTFELPSGAALILSVAKYESPAGKKLEDEGVTPGTVVGASEDQEGPDEDEPTVLGAVPQPTAPTAKPAVQVDEQLKKALELLKSKPA